MPRALTVTEPSLAELERLLKLRRKELDTLVRERTEVEERLKEIDLRIQALSGTARKGRRSRAKNKTTLIDAIEQTLSNAGKPLPVGEIMKLVKSSGYESSSANFRGLINQTLIKGKQFHSTARGVYGLKR